MNCCSHCESADKLFNESVARGDLEAYRRRGPTKPTRLLLNSIRKQGVAGMTLLDIGGGVGAIQHELARAGVSAVVAVDASSAYLEAAQREAERQGYAERVNYRHGDFVALAGEIDPADIVTLDRVICCYPNMPVLVALSSQRARRVYALVFPRDNVLSRGAAAVINLAQRIRRDPFRFYVHSTRKITEIARQNGLRPHMHRKRLFWQVMVFTRA